MSLQYQYFQKFPEKFYFEGLQDMNPQPQPQYLPIYFGNVCLRFLPVSLYQYMQQQDHFKMLAHWYNLFDGPRIWILKIVVGSIGQAGHWNITQKAPCDYC